MLYNIIVPELFTFFCMIYDLVTCDIHVTFVTVICDIMLTPNPKSKK